MADHIPAAKPAMQQPDERTPRAASALEHCAGINLLSASLLAAKRWDKARRMSRDAQRRAALHNVAVEMRVA
jgi:hypothetical protein